MNAIHTVVATNAETGNLFAAVAITLPPHDPGAAPHRHAHHAEGCYVVDGTLALTQGECTTTLTPGTAALVRPGVSQYLLEPDCSADDHFTDLSPWRD